jgi:hypothetical protein
MTHAADLQCVMGWTLVCSEGEGGGAGRGEGGEGRAAAPTWKRATVVGGGRMGLEPGLTCGVLPRASPRAGTPTQAPAVLPVSHIRSAGVCSAAPAPAWLSGVPGSTVSLPGSYYQDTAQPAGRLHPSGRVPHQRAGCPLKGGGWAGAVMLLAWRPAPVRMLCVLV